MHGEGTAAPVGGTPSFAAILRDEICDNDLNTVRQTTPWQNNRTPYMCASLHVVGAWSGQAKSSLALEHYFHSLLHRSNNPEILFLLQLPLPASHSHNHYFTSTSSLLGTKS